MKADNNSNDLDRLIREAIGRDNLSFDFGRWRQEHSRTLEESQWPQRSRSPQPTQSFWQHATLHCRPVAGLVAAAAVIIVAAFGIFLFNGSLDGATAAYAKVTAAVREVPWMHIRHSGYSLDGQGNRTSKEGERDTDLWYSFNPQVIVYRHGDGYVDYYDYTRSEIRQYNPKTKRIIVSALPASRPTVSGSSLWDWLETNIARIVPPGGRATRSMGLYDGQEVEVLEMESAYRPGVATIQSKVFVDPATSLPIGEETTYINTNIGKPQLVMTGTFDYPTEGPVDLYALGVPADAPIVNNIPLPPWNEIQWDTYEPHRGRPIAKKFIAVTVQNLDLSGHPVVSVRISYDDGLHLRTEEHDLSRVGHSVEEEWEQQAPELGDTLDSMLRWSRAYKAHGTISIQIYTDDKWFSANRDESGSWSRTEQTLKIHLTEEALWGLSNIVDLAWPSLYSGEIVQDDYARENRLIRVETGPHGVSYVNPDRDYICQRKTDPGIWAGDVTEFGQTNEGRWYPVRITGGPFGYRMFLDTHPQFPEGIFDPNLLPKSGK